MRHLDEGTIHAWLDGALSADKEREAESHAARCTPCASAVADVRGLIAASSRILTALDDVPAGVIPQSYRAMPATRETRRLPLWTMRVAASVAVIATGTVLVMRTGALRPEVESKNTTDALARSSGDTGAIVPDPLRTPAAAPATADSNALANAPAQPFLDEKLTSNGKAKDEEPARAEPAPAAPGAFANAAKSQELQKKPDALTPALPPAAAAVGAAVGGAAGASSPSSEADKENAAGLASSISPKAPKIEVAQTMNAAAAKRAMPAEHSALPPGLRLVSEQTGTEQARLVQRRVFEVRPGLEVTFAIFGPPPSDSRTDADSAARDSAGRADRREFRMRQLNEEGAGINSIQWSDSAGTDFTLSGRLPMDSLRALRPLLPSPPHRP